MGAQGPDQLLPPPAQAPGPSAFYLEKNGNTGLEGCGIAGGLAQAGECIPIHPPPCKAWQFQGAGRGLPKNDLC